MKQNIPKAFGDLTSFAEKSADGLHSLGAILGVTYNTEEVVRQILDVGIKANTDHRTAISNRMAATAAQNATAKEVRVFLTSVRDVLKRTLGTSYSEKWGEAGFYSRTLALPGTLGGLLGTSKAVQVYLEVHPDLEVPNLDLTSSKAGEWYAKFSTDISAVSAARTTQREKKLGKTAATKALRDRMQKLYAELKQLMAADDPRWFEFGFNVPADLAVPAAPEGFTVTPGLPGHVSTSWMKPVGATRFRLFSEVVGVDEKPSPVATTTEASFDLGGLTSGAHVKLYVIASNAAGESLPSATIEIVVP